MKRATVALHPMCNTCGWRKGGADSWDGKKCKCGHWEPPNIHEASKVHPSDFNQPPTLRCGKCREVFDRPFAEFFFRDKNGPFGWRKWCKACYSEAPSILRRSIAGRAILAVAAAITITGPTQAQTTIGLHLVSVHVPKRDYQHNFNPGIYVITEDGLTLGAYRNTLDRMSFYAGLTAERGPFALTLGVTTGYQKRMVPVACADPANDKGNGCLSQRGSTNGVLQPFLTPSVRLPALAGLTPRLSYIPGFGVNASVLHLSIERDF